MRFIHSADWQIGMRAVHAGTSADKVREARLRTASAVCELAGKEAVDFILLAGDTFEHNGVDRAVVASVATLLAKAPCPVYILPGNHDPVQPGSVWDDARWRSADNVTILADRTPVRVNGGVLLPCPLRVRRSAEDPTSWIPKGEREGDIRIVAAHGNVGELMAEDGGFPIQIDTPARTGADYVALGHWHSTILFQTGGATRMAYSGTPETTRFGEKDSGNVLVVSIDGPGSAPQIRTRRTGHLRWHQVSAGETVTAQGQLADILRRLDEISEPDSSLVEVILTGLLFERDQDDLGKIERASTRYLHARLDCSGLRPAPDDDGWVQHLPAGAARIAAEHLRRRSAVGGPEAEVATQALLQLYAFSQEVRA
jgi:DNA repair exonuclease SbcCD nuclease subunit